METTSTSFFHAGSASRPLPIVQFTWVGEDRLAVSNPMGLGLYDKAGKLLAFNPNDFGIKLSWRPLADFVRYINGGVRDWYWKKQAVKPVEDIHFHVFDGTFDRQGNYFCCGESSGGLEDVGKAAVFNKHVEKLAQYQLMYRAKQLSLSPDGSRAAFCTSNSLIEVHPFPKEGTEQVLSFFAGGPVMAAAWSATGRYLAVALVHGWMEIWDMTSREKVGFFPDIRNGKWHFWMNMAFVPGSDNLILAGSLRDTHLFDWRQGKILKTKAGFGFAISPSGQSIAVGFTDGKVMISSLEEYLLWGN